MMRRDQDLHEELIPLLVDRLGVRRYLEFGFHENETVRKVRERCGWGVEIHAVDIREASIPNEVPGVRYHIMSTRAFCREVAPKYAPFDMVFIDADHSAASVCSDFEGIWPYVADEGLVLLHDTNPETVADTQPGYCGDAWRFAKFIAQDGDDSYEAVTLPYHPGLTVVRKRVEWGPRE